MAGTRTLSVVQWATGNIGARSLRAVIEHPGLTLVGVYVHSDDKAGRDAGDLCGLDPVSITATNDIEERPVLYRWSARPGPVFASRWTRHK